MRAFADAEGCPSGIVLHCLMHIPPLVNYLTDPAMELDIHKKRVNAAAFTRTLAATANQYWCEETAPLHISDVVSCYKKIHRATHVNPAVALRQMCQIIQDSLLPTDNYYIALGGLWIVHGPGCKQDTVQQLMNATAVDGLPHLIFIHLDRGDRTKRFIDYGTCLKLVKTAKYIEIHKYELVSVLMEDPSAIEVFAKPPQSAWLHISSVDNIVRPLPDLNQLISVKAQVLVYLRAL